MPRLRARREPRLASQFHRPGPPALCGRAPVRRAALLCTIVQIVHTCHSMGVMHRDIKPEIFLLLNKDEPPKANDFGLSVSFKEGELPRDIVGSAYYIPPKVLKRKYGPEAEIWSVGVKLYIFLAGGPPFFGRNVVICVLLARPNA